MSTHLLLLCLAEGLSTWTQVRITLGGRDFKNLDAQTYLTFNSSGEGQREPSTVLKASKWFYCGSLGRKLFSSTLNLLTFPIFSMYPMSLQIKAFSFEFIKSPELINPPNTLQPYTLDLSLDTAVTEGSYSNHWSFFSVPPPYSLLLSPYPTETVLMKVTHGLPGAKHCGLFGASVLHSFSFSFLLLEMIFPWLPRRHCQLTSPSCLSPSSRSWILLSQSSPWRTNQLLPLSRWFPPVTSLSEVPGLIF